MSDSGQVADDDWSDEGFEQALVDNGAELDALLDEVNSDQEPHMEDGGDELATSPEDAGDFEELLAVPEVDEEMDPVVRDTTVDEVVGDDLLLPEPQAAKPGEKSMTSDPLAEVAAIAAERNAEATKENKSGGGRGLQFALIGLAILALLVAGYASWQGYSNAMRMDELAMGQQRVGASASVPADGTELRAELEKLMAQVNEIAATLDGSLVELRDNNKAALDAMSQRIDKLETAAKQQEMAAAQQKTTTAKTESVSTESTVKPLVEKASATTTLAAGGWAVNLISLSSEKEADKELSRLRNLGLRAEKQRVEQDGRIWFRLRVPGFTSHDGAKAYIKTVEDKVGISNAWVGKN